MKFHLMLYTYIFLFLYATERVIFAIEVPSKSKSNEKRWLTVVPTLSYAIICFLSIYEFSTRHAPLNLVATLSGVLGFVVGIIFRYRAIRIFKRNNQPWDNTIDPSNIRAIILNGIYSRLRHPYYLSVMLELCGLCLILNTFRALVLVFVIQMPLLLKRIKVEEIMLINKFGNEYIRYKETVPMWRI